jgi:hypothetical protein
MDITWCLVGMGAGRQGPHVWGSRQPQTSATLRGHWFRKHWPCDHRTHSSWSGQLCWGAEGSFHFLPVSFSHLLFKKIFLV